MNPAENFRIICAIARKDIGDALRNRITLSIMLGVGLMLALNMLLPLLLVRDTGPVAVILDPGQTPALVEVIAQRELGLRSVASQTELEATLAASSRPLLGIVVPPGLWQTQTSGETITLEGYYVHWMRGGQIAELVAHFEDALSDAIDQPVRIAVEGHAVYPSFELGRQSSLLATNLTLLLLVTGLALVPYLWIEERESHTFEALLVSPARFSQVVIGKTLAGLFYCLCAAVMVFAFNSRYIVHWEVALLAFLLGSAFAVSAGLLLGMSTQNPATVNMVVALLLLLMVVPALAVQLMGPRLPAALQSILPWVPAVAMMQLARLSLVGAIPAAPLWESLGILAAESLLLYALVLWRVRRSDR